MSVSTRLGRISAMFLCCIAICGCGWFQQNVVKVALFDPNRVSLQREAGSTHVAVLSIARWESYPAVQPQFSLTSDQALAAAIPDTSIIENKLLSSTAVQLSAQLTAGAGTAPTVTAPSVDVSGLPGTGAALSQLGQDPLLRYWAATALYEEVQILNRYIKDAAISDNYYPYLVRTQVALLPKHRNLPYDAYTSMSFFADDFADYPPAKRFMSVSDITAIIDKTIGTVGADQVSRWTDQTNGQPQLSKLLGLKPDLPGTQLFQPQVLRTKLLDSLDNCDSSMIQEDLSTLALRDGLILAAAHDKPNPHAVDMIQTALAYARDRSPRFAGFRGFDSSEYTDTNAFLNKYSKIEDQSALIAAVSSYRKERIKERDTVTKIKEFMHPDERRKNADKTEKDAATQLNKLITPTSSHGICVGSCDREKRKSLLVSLDDFELSLNDASSAIRNAHDAIEWKSKVIALLNGQAEAGSNYRPYVADPPPRTPIVIPLVVTDDLQSAIESRSAEQIRQIAISLAAVAGKANVGGGLANLDEQLRTTLGRSLDSTFTIARQADNTVRARFGATLQAGAQYAMIPEAHNVTLLVLVPKAYIDSVRKPSIHIETRTEFVDAETGLKLPPVSDWERGEYVTKVLENEGVPLAVGSPDKLIQDAENNDMDDFKARLGGDSVNCEKIWTELLEWYSLSAEGFVTIPLERPELPSIEPTPLMNLVAAVDDTKKTMTVTVRGTGDLFQQSISAELWATATPPPPTDHTVKLQTDKTDLTLSQDKDRNLSITTKSIGTIEITPESDGVTLTQKQHGTITLPTTHPATLQIPNAAGTKLELTESGINVTTAKSTIVSTVGKGAGDSSIRKTIVLWSTATTVGDDKRTITFTFPSLAALNLASTGKVPDLQMKVHFFRADNIELPGLPGDNLVPLQYFAQKPKSLAIKLTAQAKVINAKPDGTGELLVTVSGLDSTTNPGKSYLTVDGAGLTTANLFGKIDSTGQLFTPLPILSDKMHAGKVAITSNGVIRLSLEGLNPIANVVVSAEDDNGAKVETGITEIVEQSLHGADNIVETNITSVKPTTK